MGNLVLILALSLPTMPRYCVFCIGCYCCYHHWCVHRRANFHCVWGRGRLWPALYLKNWNASSSLVSTWSHLRLFRERQQKNIKTKKKHSFHFLTLLLWSARPSLKSVLALSRRLRMKRQTERGGKLWC